MRLNKLLYDKSGINYNVVLLNQYRDGNDSVSWHTDAEKELGKDLQ